MVRYRIRSAARLVVVTIPFVTRIKHATGSEFFGKLPVIGLFSVYRAHCFGLTGVGHREMIVQLSAAR